MHPRWDSVGPGFVGSAAGGGALQPSQVTRRLYAQRGSTVADDPLSGRCPSAAMATR